MLSEEPAWNPLRWPPDGLGKVFLCRAAVQVGKALFGSQWTGTEPLVRPPPPLPFSDSLITGIAIREDAARLIGRSPTAGELFGPKLTPEEWTEARAKREDEIELAKQAEVRWGEVRAVLTCAFINGVLTPVLQHEDGSFTPILTSSWMTTNNGRFDTGLMSRRQPLADTSTSLGLEFLFDHGWVFLDAQEFSPFLVEVAKLQDSAPMKNAGGITKKSRDIVKEVTAWIIARYLKRSPGGRFAFKKDMLAAAMEGNWPELRHNEFGRAWANAVASGPYEAWTANGSQKVPEPKPDTGATDA